MKLAECGCCAGDMQKKLASLRERVAQNAVVQDGETPHEDPNLLLEEAVSLLRELEGLVFKINQANLASKLPDGRSLTEAIARCDTLIQQHSLVQAAIACATDKEPEADATASARSSGSPPSTCRSSSGSRKTCRRRSAS